METRTLRAHRGDARERLDVALLARFAGLPGISRTKVQGWIASGLVRVNGLPARKPSDRLAAGDEVEILLPPAPPRLELTPQPIPLSILYEDEHLVALDKPPGLVVHPTYKNRDGTLLNALMWHLGRQGGDPGRPGFVGRLDKGTSGVVLAARSGTVHGRLARAMGAPGFEKEYLAVVYGRTDMRKGRIDLKLSRDPVDRRRMVASKTEGLAASTLFEVLAESDAAGISLLRCRLLTGRTHQIRAHLRAACLPIVGDPVYGEPRWKGIRGPALAALCRAFPRQALHARRLAFAHPMTGAPLEIVAPLPEDLNTLLIAAGLQVP
jgi:23S rRNA pseudouridine1911/1915/1917 synthase